jgi:hypothetical protein
MRNRFTPLLLREWQRFAICANWSSLHPLDEQRFWRFVFTARRLGYPLTSRLVDELARETLPVKLGWWTKDQVINGSTIRLLGSWISCADRVLDALKGERKRVRRL